MVYPDTGQRAGSEQVAAADPAALAAINQHYRTGLVLLGKLQDGSADWTLVSGGQTQHWSGQGASADGLLGDAGNSLVDRVGKQLNVIGAGRQRRQAVDQRPELGAWTTPT